MGKYASEALEKCRVSRRDKEIEGVVFADVDALRGLCVCVIFLEELKFFLSPWVPRKDGQVSYKP